MNMENHVKTLLPIGSVVALKNGKKRLMIFGIVQDLEDDEEGKNGAYDYVGVPYPEGNMGQEFQYMFNHSDIDLVFFRGFEDIERQEFIERLSNYFKESAEG